MTTAPVLALDPSSAEPDSPCGLYAKLAQVVAEIGSVQARGFHDFLKTKYVTEDDLLNAVRAKLSARNVVMLPSVDNVDARSVKLKTKQGEKATTITTIAITFTFCDGDSGETHSCQWAGAGEDPSDKGLSKAYTQALRYFLLKAFLVSSDAESVSDPKPAVPRTDGQRPLTDEQYQGIVDAYAASGNNQELLELLLEKHNVPLAVGDESLSISQRVQLLGAGDAVDVLKKLSAVPAPEPVT